MATVKTYLRAIRRTVWYSLAALLVILAVLVSLFRILLPDLADYRTDLEQLASTFLDNTVKIDAMDARLVGFTPTLIFDDVYMLDKTGERELVRFEQARLSLALIESLRQRKIVPSKLTIEGIQLAVTRHADGRFVLQGVDVQDLEKTFQTDNPRGSGELADWLFKRSRLELRNSTILWKDLKKSGKTLRFDDVNLLIRNDNQRHQLDVQVKLPPRMGKRFDIAMDVRGNILNPREMTGQIYMRGDSVNLDKWGVEPEYMGVTLHSGIADFQLWGDWKDNAIQRLSGDLTAYELDLSLPVMDKPYQVKLLGGLFDVTNEAHGWTLNVDRFQYMTSGDIWPQTRFRIQHHQGAGTSQSDSWQVDTDYFRLEDVTGLLLQTNLPDTEQRKFLQTVKPAGDVSTLHFRQGGEPQGGNYQLQADFTHLSAQPWEKFPGFNGLQGQIDANNRHGHLQLASGYATLDFPRLFREPLKLNRFQGALHWLADAERWRIWSDTLQVNTDDVELAADLLLDVPRKSPVSPYLDMQARFKNGKAEFAERYYPTGILDQELVNWLDRNIVSGHVSEGGMVFNGRLKDFPFRNNQGQFKVEFDAHDAQLDYQKHWPAVSGIDLSAVFTGQGMEILLQRGRLFDTRLSPSRARITDFKKPQLHLQLDANGRLADVARFLVESPAAPGGRAFVQRSRIEGSAHTRFEAFIPLSGRMQQQASTRYQGEVNLADGQLYMLDGKLDLTALNGQIVFNQDQLSSKNLSGQLLGESVELELDTRVLPRGNKQINILASGRLNAGQISDRFALPWADAVSGSTTWQGAVMLDTVDGSAQAPLIRIDSTLEGIRSTLPPPLNKPAQTASRLVSEIRFDNAGQTSVTLDLHDKMVTRFELAHGEQQSRLQRGTLHFGPGTAQLPADHSLLISGSLDGFKPSDWIALTKPEQNKNQPQHGLKLPVRIDMQRVALATADEPDVVKDVDKPVTYPPPPTNLPDITGRIEQLTYADHTLGRLEFDLREMQKGLRLQRLSLQGDNLQLHASGDWWYDSNRHSTSVNYEMTSDNLGVLLDSLNYSAIIDGGNMVMRGDLQWGAPPAAVALELLTGTIHLKVDDGSIVRVNPGGAGRLLGLFSLSALPRRLMLDFRDTFQEGFSFDELRGEIQLRDGNAYSNNLRIGSPAAEIRIQGRTGLVARDFDQQVVVTPQVGDSLPVASGLLFGTQVGAAILFLGKLLGGGIDKASAKHYQVTGSWEEPVITPLTSPAE